MNLNYMTSPYLRARFADGSIDWIRPAGIAALGARRPVAFAFGHLLLDAFATELLIGLFQYAMAPESEDEWHDRWAAPPGPEEVDALLAAHADGFGLYGDTPAFQDREAASVEASPVGRLLPTSAGEQGRKYNQDILLPEIRAMRPEAAMVALAFVQAHSPAGGRGTRTSLAGGGPLRSWVEAEDGDIYRTVLANQLPRSMFDGLGTRGGIDPLPWRATLAGRRTRANTPAEHLYTACPRRILLSAPEPADPERACDITGERNVPLVTTLHQKADGPDYDSVGFRHPLTPYVYRKDKGAFVAFPKLAATLPLGTAWRERAGLFAPKGGPGTEGPVPARVVDLWRETWVQERPERLRIRVFGLRCDKAKVLGLVDGHFTFRVAPQGKEAVFDGHANELADLGQRLAGLLRAALREARYGPGEREKIDYEFGSEAVSAFWFSTEAEFDRHLRTVAAALAANAGLGDPEMVRARSGFLRFLRGKVQELFDEQCFHLLTGPYPDRAAEARRRLLNFSAALINPPDADKPRRGARSRRKSP